MEDPTRRFSGRVDDYIKYRPTYPRAVVGLLEEECDLTPDSIIADVGSGTGILSTLFLENGNRVLGIEPNPDMRLAAERSLQEPYEDLFHSVAATAEATTLLDQSMDFVTAGQSFHWFDPRRTRDEFARILKPRGLVVLVWNRRRGPISLMRDFDRLLDTCGENHRRHSHHQVGEEEIAAFFGPGGFELGTFYNEQTFDLDGLKGRAMSSSSVPKVGRFGHEEMMAELEELFEAHQTDGLVTFEYDAEVYYGHLYSEESRPMRGVYSSF